MALETIFCILDIWCSLLKVNKYKNIFVKSYMQQEVIFCQEWQKIVAFDVDIDLGMEVNSGEMTGEQCYNDTLILVCKALFKIYTQSQI